MPPPVMSPKSEGLAWVRCKKLEDTLEAVSMAVDAFPDRMLRLDSPAILNLRGAASLDELIINALQRVFPHTAAALLSALAALLMVDSYLSSLEGMEDTADRMSASRPKDKYWRLAGKSNECLHDIPTKARATLGIHLPNVTELQARARALRRRAETMAVCVRVQGQRLLEAISGRYDDVLWRTLKVLADTLERSDMSSV